MGGRGLNPRPSILVLSQMPMTSQPRRPVHANFQAASFTGVGGEWGDRHTLDPYTKNLTPPLLGLGRINCQ